MLKECESCIHCNKGKPFCQYGCDNYLQSKIEGSCVNYEPIPIDEMYLVIQTRKRISSEDRYLEYKYNLFCDRAMADEFLKAKKSYWHSRSENEIIENDLWLYQLPLNQYVRFEIKKVKVNER